MITDTLVVGESKLMAFLSELRAENIKYNVGHSMDVATVYYEDNEAEVEAVFVDGVYKESQVTVEW